MNPLLILSLLFLSASSFAQQVSNVKATQQGANVIITYDLGGNPNSAFYINLLMSKNGQDFGQPLRQVIGDVGNAKPSSNKQIIWNAEKELSFYNGNAVFRVEATSLSAPMPEPVEDEIGTLEILKASQSGNKITVDFILIPSKDSHIQIKKSNDDTFIIDDVGNKAFYSNGSFGNTRIGDFISVIEKIPIRGQLIINGIIANSRRLPIIAITIVGDRTYSYNSYLYKFKNVPIISK